jgi:hypothetical protein
MKLCFLEGCELAAQITIQKTINTRGQIGDSCCDLCMPFCSVEHAAVFERIYTTITEQMATIARFAANYEAAYLTMEQLETAAESLSQIIDVNLGGQGMVILAREEFEALTRSRRMLAGTQRQLNRLQRRHGNIVEQAG